MLSIFGRVTEKLFPKPKFSPSLPDKIEVRKFPQLYAKSFGNLNHEKNFYVIHGHKAGFFSNLQFVLAHIRQAEQLKMTPVVDYMNFPGKYFDIGSEELGSNAWEYYFSQVSKYSLEEVYKSQNVFFCDGSYSWGMGHYMSNDGLWEVYQKHIQPRTEILDEVELFYQKKMASAKVLGVHFRGHEQNVAPGHPFCPTVRQMHYYTDKIVEKHEIEKIYLVTEQQRYLDSFLRRFGDMVIYSDYFRTDGIDAFKMSRPPREKHMFLLGKEIFVAGLLLAKCVGMLHSSSNVSQFARFIKQDKFEFRYTIENGVNTNNRFRAKYLYSLKKSLPRGLGGLENRLVPPLN